MIFDFVTTMVNVTYFKNCNIQLIFKRFFNEVFDSTRSSMSFSWIFVISVWEKNMIGVKAQHFAIRYIKKHQKCLEWCIKMIAGLYYLSV